MARKTFGYRLPDSSSRQPMALTLEQSLLALFIVMSQNRSAEIADLRNEIDLQVKLFGCSQQITARTGL